MRVFATLGLAAAMIATTLAPASAAINASPEHTVDYRHNIMKSMEAQANAIGQILALMVPDTNLASHFEALLISVRQTKVAFKDHIEGGKAKPEVWTNWADFSARLDKMEQGAIKAIEAAKKGGGPGYVGEYALDAMPCKACHDVYKKND
jgi:cytochrome c556